MTTFARLALTLGAFALLAGPARAQGPAAPFGGGGWFLLTNKGVQKELKVTDEQARKLEALAGDGVTKALKFRDLPAAQRKGKSQELMSTSNEDLRKGLADILKPAQVKRFDQIALQASSIEAFAIDRVREALKLTDEQSAKVKEIAGDLRKSMAGLRGEFANDRRAAMKKVAGLRKDAVEKAAALLTDDQKATWKGLTGEPYEVKFEPRPNN